MDVREFLQVHDVIYTEYGSDYYSDPMFLYVTEVGQVRFEYTYIDDLGKLCTNYQDEISLNLWLSARYKGEVYRGRKALKIAKLRGLIP